MKKLIAYIMLLSMIIILVGCGTDNLASENMGIVDLDNMTVDGKGVAISGKNINITEGGEYNIFGTLNNGMIYVDTSDAVILSLDSVNIINSNGPAIYIERADNAIIRLASQEASYIASTGDEDAENAAIYSKSELLFDGIGTIKISANNGNGIESSESITFDNGDYTIEATENGVKTDNILHIRYCYMSVYAKEGKGLMAKKGLTVDDGSISLVTGDEGMESKGTLVINGGSINIETAEDGINTGTADSEKKSKEKEPPRMPQDGEKAPVPEGKTPPVSADGIPQMPKGERPPAPDGAMPGMPEIDRDFAEAHSTTINGGSIFIKAEGDGIDSNGDLTINGGTVVIDGPSVRDNGPLDCDGIMTIAGGTVLALSDGGMVQLPRDGEGQKTVCLNVGIQNAYSLVEIKDADGNVLISHTACRDFTTVIFSHEKVKNHSDYSIFINGDKAEAEEFIGFFGGHRPDVQ